MNKTMKGLIMLLCVFAFVATMSMDALAQMGSKPQVQRTLSNYCDPVSGGKQTCRCDGVDDCENMIDTYGCDGKLINDGDEKYHCEHVILVPLDRSKKNFRSFQK